MLESSLETQVEPAILNSENLNNTEFESPLLETIIVPSSYKSLVLYYLNRLQSGHTKFTILDKDLKPIDLATRLIMPQ